MPLNIMLLRSCHSLVLSSMPAVAGSARVARCLAHALIAPAACFLTLQEREEEQKRLAAAKAARERQQQQQNKNAQQKQQLMPGKPGIGALPGTGAAPMPAPPAAPPAAQVVASGSVQGVVYKSKWAQRAAQHQG
jgi:hypothetical protein